MFCRELRAELEKARAEAERLRAELEATKAEVERLRRENEELRRRAEDLQQVSRAVAKSQGGDVVVWTAMYGNLGITVWTAMGVPMPKPKFGVLEPRHVGMNTYGMEFRGISNNEVPVFALPVGPHVLVAAEGLRKRRTYVLDWPVLRVEGRHILLQGPNKAVLRPAVF